MTTVPPRYLLLGTLEEHPTRSRAQGRSRIPLEGRKIPSGQEYLDLPSKDIYQCKVFQKTLADLQWLNGAFHLPWKLEVGAVFDGAPE